jgi:pimeloyl-ACP methyl ester carboxylesterase
VSLPPADYERFVEWRARVALSPEFDRWAHVSALLYQMIYHQPVRYELIVMPQTGHVPHLEHPEVFIDRLLGFLNANAGSAAHRP